MDTQQGSGSSQKMIIGGVIIALVVILGGGFMLLNSSNSTAQQPQTNTETQTQSETASNMETSVDQSTDAAQETEVKEFVIESKGLNFTPNNLIVNEGDTVKITYKNTMGKHDLVIDEFNVRIPMVDAREEETITFVADKKGSFEFYCSVPGHRQSGMKGTLVVQ